MAVQRPIVLIAGVARQLPAADVLPAASFIDDAGITAGLTWSGSKLNATLGDISAALTTINGL